MKTIKNFMLLVMTISLVSLTSCKSDDDGGDGGNAPSGTLTARIDGTNYQSLDISSSATVANNGQNLIIILEGITCVKLNVRQIFGENGRMSN